MTFVATAHRQASVSGGDHRPLRVRVGGRVGSGKTALVEGVDQIAKFVIEKGGLAKESDTLTW
jgi:Ni2+-binding GTPase involved in maturation of urease and hydrogenase